jgi:transposase
MPGVFIFGISSMPVNILNLPGLKVLDFKETDAEYHIRAEPAAISRLCPHCGRSHDTIKHAQKTLFVRDLPSHGKSVAILHIWMRLVCSANCATRPSPPLFRKLI